MENGRFAFVSPPLGA